MSEKLPREEEFTDESLNTGLWKQIISLLGPQRKHLYIVFVDMALIAAFETADPIMSRIAVDDFIIGNAPDEQLKWFILAFIVVTFVPVFLVYQMVRHSGMVETGFSYDVRKRLFDKLQLLSFSYYDKNPIGWIMSRLTTDINRLAEILAWSLEDMVWGVFKMIFITVVMLATDWKLALLVLMVVPVLAWIAAWFQKRILRNYRDVRRTNSLITSAFNEGITGAKTTKTLVLEDQNYGEFAELSGRMKEKSVRAATLSAALMPIVTTLSYIAIGALLWYGGDQVLLGRLQFGTLLMFSQYATSFFEPLREVAGLIGEMEMAQASGERVLSLLNEEPAIQDRPEVIEKYGTVTAPKKENFPPIKGDVEFRDVSFRYVENEPVLEHFNLKVKAGSTIALVGQTGSGKSTVVNLFCRFYEPVSGQILIDGVDYRERSIGWLHSNLGYVLQTPHLFSGTIRENIRYGNLDATDEQVEAAARLVNADAFIRRLEKGYDTDVGEGGGRLSTGEKQLVSFARAVVADPRLFVLDEATSSIDTESERLIQNAVENLLKDRTSFVVAHRLSTIVHSDWILVMKDGRIFEQGTHPQLMAKKGYYYHLYTNQFQEEQQEKLMGTQRNLTEEEMARMIHAR